jgi:hypothetical protein
VHGWALGDRAYWSPARAGRLRRQGLQLLAPPPRSAKAKVARLPRWVTPTRRRIETVIGQLVERYHAKRVGARDGWHLWSRWQRKLLSHTLAAYLCQRAGLGSLRFAGRTRGRLSPARGHELGPAGGAALVFGRRAGMGRGRVRRAASVVRAGAGAVPQGPDRQARWPPTLGRGRRQPRDDAGQPAASGPGGMAAQAWHAAEAWLGEQLSPVTIPGVDQAGPRLYLASVGDVQLAHRGLSRLAVSQAGPASSTAPPNPAPDGLPPVVAALTANQRAWLRDALDFLDRQDIDLVPGDFACRGFPEGRPAATVLGAFAAGAPQLASLRPRPAAVPHPLGLETGGPPRRRNRRARGRALHARLGFDRQRRRQPSGASAAGTPPTRRTPPDPPDG